MAACRAARSNRMYSTSLASPSALEAKYVPVKLNANEYPAIAQGFGITRVPTDVILTPDGQVLSKGISPATPSAYLSAVTQVANQYASQSGHAFQTAVATAPMPSVLNSAYANLQIGQPTPPSPSLTTPPGPSIPLAERGSNRRTDERPLCSSGTASRHQPASERTEFLRGDRPKHGAGRECAGSATKSDGQPLHEHVCGLGAAPSPTTPTTPLFGPAQRPPITPVDSSVPPASYSGGVPTSAEASQPRPRFAELRGGCEPERTIIRRRGRYEQSDECSSRRSAVAGGAPPLAFDGYCPVSMRSMWKWVPGDARYGAIHRGRTYWFAGPKEQQQFLANPDYYSPALSGLDPVMAIDHKQSIPGVREHSLDYDNQFYMFSSEATLQQFSANPEKYATGVRQAMGIQATTPVVRLESCQ